MNQKQKEIIQLQKEMSDLLDEVEVISTKIKKLQRVVKCSHPKEHVIKYDWVSDNGYGRQSAMIGKICLICKMTDPHDCNHWNY